MMKNNQPIGVFDSGIGGMTIIPYLLKHLPNERLIYFGDTARTPYGSKSISTIKKFTEEIVEFLLEKQVKMIAIACNTVTSTCLPDLQNKYPDIPIVGVIEPAVKKLISLAPESAKVGIIGTRVTIANKAYSSIICKYNSKLRVYEKACPLFVPLIEESLAESEIANLTVKHYLKDLQDKIDYLILGCTHYPLLNKFISQTLPGVKIINPSEEMVYGIEEALVKHKLLAAEPVIDNIVYVSDLFNNTMVNNMIEHVFQERVRIGLKNFDLFLEESPHF